MATTWECFTRTLRDTSIRFVVQPSDIDPIIIVGLLFLCDNRFIVWNFDNNEQNITIFTKNTSQSACYSNDRDDPIMARINNSPLGIDHSIKGFESLLDPMDVGVQSTYQLKNNNNNQFNSVTYNCDVCFFVVKLQLLDLTRSVFYTIVSRCLVRVLHNFVTWTVELLELSGTTLQSEILLLKTRST